MDYTRCILRDGEVVSRPDHSREDRRLCSSPIFYTVKRMIIIISDIQVTLFPDSTNITNAEIDRQKQASRGTWYIAKGLK